MSIDDSELEKQLLSLSVPEKSPDFEQNILALALLDGAKSQQTKSTWVSFFSSLFSGPQAAMAFSLVLCFGLWMGWTLPTDDVNPMVASIESEGYTASFSYDDFVSVDGEYEGDLF